MTLLELVAHWRTTADTLRPYNPGAAFAFEQTAGQLEETLRTMDGEALTLAAASRESGHSPDHLRKLVASQQIPSAAIGYLVRLGARRPANESV